MEGHTKFSISSRTHPSFVPPLSRPPVLRSGGRPATTRATRPFLPAPAHLHCNVWNSILIAETTADFGPVNPSFEARLDVGALFSLVIMSLVVALFWARVITAITDREKRESLERIQREIRVKKLTGRFDGGDEETLRLAEEEQARPALGEVGSFLRKFRLVNEGRRVKEDGGADDNSTE